VSFANLHSQLQPQVCAYSEGEGIGTQALSGRGSGLPKHPGVTASPKTLDPTQLLFTGECLFRVCAEGGNGPGREGIHAVKGTEKHKEGTLPHNLEGKQKTTILIYYYYSKGPNAGQSLGQGHSGEEDLCTFSTRTDLWRLSTPYFHRHCSGTRETVLLVCEWRSGFSAGREGAVFLVKWRQSWIYQKMILSVCRAGRGGQDADGSIIKVGQSNKLAQLVTSIIGPAIVTGFHGPATVISFGPPIVTGFWLREGYKNAQIVGSSIASPLANWYIVSTKRPNHIRVEYQ
jgi:hypothetical protein